MGKGRAKLSKGRPRLTGPRAKNGRRILSRTPPDYGADHVQLLRARFARFQDGKAAQQVYDPIGRAWAVGLLENPHIDPAVLRDAGRNYALRYWGHYPSAPGVANYEQDIRKGPTCVDGEDPTGERFGVMDRLLTDAGRAARNVVQEMVVDNHWFPDANPAWLERLINDRLVAHRQSVVGQLGLRDDLRKLKLAIEGLMALAGEDAMRRAAA